MTGERASQLIAATPTPGNSRPATRGGTRNNVGRIAPGFRIPFTNRRIGWRKNNWVKSFLIKSPDPMKFTDIVVNYTINGQHDAAEGFVMRYGILDRNGNLHSVVTYGEGDATLQNESISGLTDWYTEAQWDEVNRKAGLTN